MRDCKDCGFPFSAWGECGCSALEFREEDFGEVFVVDCDWIEVSSGKTISLERIGVLFDNYHLERRDGKVFLAKGV